jgi:hypothetical protein
LTLISLFLRLSKGTFSRRLELVIGNRVRTTVILATAAVLFLLSTIGVTAAGFLLDRTVTAHVTVTPAVISRVSVIAPPQVTSGSQFTILISVQPATVIAGGQFNLAFDPVILSISSIAEGDLFSQNGDDTIFFDGITDNGAGTLTGAGCVVIGADNSVSGPGTLAVITCMAGPGTGTSPLTLSGVVLGNADAQSVPITIVNGTVLVD